MIYWRIQLTDKATGRRGPPVVFPCDYGSYSATVTGLRIMRPQCYSYDESVFETHIVDVRRV